MHRSWLTRTAPGTASPTSLLDVIEDESEPTERRIAAAQSLADRGFGKATPPLTPAVPEQPTVIQVISPIQAILDSLDEDGAAAHGEIGE